MRFGSILGVLVLVAGCGGGGGGSAVEIDGVGDALADGVAEDGGLEDVLPEIGVPADVDSAFDSEPEVEIFEGGSKPEVTPPETSAQELPNGAWQVSTAHYLVTAGMGEEDTVALAQVLEAAFDDLVVIFGGDQPEETPLVVHVYATQEQLEAGVPDMGAGAGGYYDPATQIASMGVQPTPYYTRSLALHEAAHQFHFLARLGNTGSLLGWYMEALAVWAQIYDWDGEETTLGTLPLATLEDFAEQGLAHLLEMESLGAMIDGSATWSYPLGRLLYRYLDHGHPEGFASWRKAVDADPWTTGSTMLALFEEHIGPAESIHQELLAWGPTDQEPFQMFLSGWTHMDADEVLGDSGGAWSESFMVTTGDISSLEVTLDIGEINEEIPATPERSGTPGGEAGIVVGWVDMGAHVKATIDSTGHFLVLDSSKFFDPLVSEDLGLEGAVTLGYSAGVFTLNGEAYGPFEVNPGPAGLMVKQGPIHFWNLAYETE
jgi:hypothetical protein